MSADDADTFPWYVKLMLALTILVIIFVIVVDLLRFMGGA